MMARGVVVTGSGRSGTSMVAGILAAHGVFFGQTKPGDKWNPRGYWEHPAIPLPRARVKGWPGAWWEALRVDGWDGESCWGAKQLTTRWRWLLAMEPAVIALTVRPEADVVASMARFNPRLRIRRHLAKYRAGLRQIQKRARCPIITVETDALVKGEYLGILPVFHLLGLPFDGNLAGESIVPTFWHGGSA